MEEGNGNGAILDAVGTKSLLPWLTGRVDH
jgi:hypothetical protein